MSIFKRKERHPPPGQDWWLVDRVWDAPYARRLRLERDGVVVTVECRPGQEKEARRLLRRALRMVNARSTRRQPSSPDTYDYTHTQPT